MTRHTALMLLHLFLLFILPSVWATDLNYWIEPDSTGAPAKVWVKVPSIPANGSVTIYARKETGFQPNGDVVFEFFDDFEGDSLDTSKWTINGATVSVQDSVLDVTGGSYGQVYSQYFDFGHTLRAKVRIASESDECTGRAHFGWDGRPDYDDFQAHVICRDGVGKAYRLSGASTAQDFSRYVDYSTWHIIEATYLSNKVMVSTDDGAETASLNISASGRVNIHIWTYSSGEVQLDWVAVRKYAPSEPTVTVTDKGSCYEITISNPNNTDLTDFQVSISANDLGVTSTTESIHFSDQPISNLTITLTHSPTAQSDLALDPENNITSVTVDYNAQINVCWVVVTEVNSEELNIYQRASGYRFLKRRGGFHGEFENGDYVMLRDVWTDTTTIYVDFTPYEQDSHTYHDIVGDYLFEAGIRLKNDQIFVGDISGGGITLTTYTPGVRYKVMLYRDGNVWHSYFYDDGTIIHRTVDVGNVDYIGERIVIGDTGTDGSRPFRGKIHEVLILNRLPEDNEIEAIFDGYVPDSNVVFYTTSFDQAFGEIIKQEIDGVHKAVEYNEAGDYNVCVSAIAYGETLRYPFVLDGRSASPPNYVGTSEIEYDIVNLIDVATDEHGMTLVNGGVKLELNSFYTYIRFYYGDIGSGERRDIVAPLSGTYYSPSVIAYGPDKLQVLGKSSVLQTITVEPYHYYDVLFEYNGSNGSFHVVIFDENGSVLTEVNESEEPQFNIFYIGGGERGVWRPLNLPILFAVASDRPFTDDDIAEIRELNFYVVNSATACDVVHIDQYPQGLSLDWNQHIPFTNETIEFNGSATDNGTVTYKWNFPDFVELVDFDGEVSEIVNLAIQRDSAVVGSCNADPRITILGVKEYLKITEIRVMVDQEFDEATAHIRVIDITTGKTVRDANYPAAFYYPLRAVVDITPPVPLVPGHSYKIYVTVSGVQVKCYSDVSNPRPNRPDLVDDLPVTLGETAYYDYITVDVYSIEDVFVKFSSAGTYTVTLTVTDDVGLSKTKTVEVPVFEYPSVSADTGNIKHTTTSLLVKKDERLEANVGIDWGDGTETTDFIESGLNSRVYNHVYAEPEEYNVSVTFNLRNGPWSRSVDLSASATVIDLNLSAITGPCNEKTLLNIKTFNEQTNEEVSVTHNLYFTVTYPDGYKEERGAAITGSEFNVCTNATQSILFNMTDSLFDSNNIYASRTFRSWGLSVKQPDNLSEYVVKKSEASPIDIYVYNSYGVGVKDVTVEALRFDAGNSSWYAVAMGRTDTSGKTTMYLVPFEVYYKFRVLDENGNLVYELESPTTISSSTFTITLPSEVYASSYDAYTYSCSLEENEGIFRCSVSSKKNVDVLAKLEIHHIRGLLDETLCTSEKSGFGVTLECPADLNLDGRVSYVLYLLSPEKLLLDQGTIKSNPHRPTREEALATWMATSATALSLTGASAGAVVGGALTVFSMIAWIFNYPFNLLLAFVGISILVLTLIRRGGS